MARGDDSKTDQETIRHLQEQVVEAKRWHRLDLIAKNAEIVKLDNRVAALTGTDGQCSTAWETKSNLPLTRFDLRMCRAQQGWDGPTGLGVPRGLLAF